jgi:hypothetical protein
MEDDRMAIALALSAMLDYLPANDIGLARDGSTKIFTPSNRERQVASCSQNCGAFRAAEAV